MCAGGSTVVVSADRSSRTERRPASGNTPSRCANQNSRADSRCSRSITTTNCSTAIEARATDGEKRARNEHQHHSRDHAERPRPIRWVAQRQVPPAFELRPRARSAAPREHDPSHRRASRTAPSPSCRPPVGRQEPASSSKAAAPSRHRSRTARSIEPARRASRSLTSREQKVSREDRLRVRMRFHLRVRQRVRLRFPEPSGPLRGFPCTQAGFRAGATCDISVSAGECSVSRSRPGDPLSLVRSLLLRCAGLRRLPWATRRGYLCVVRSPPGLLAACAWTVSLACRVVASRRGLSARPPLPAEPTCRDRLRAAAGRDQLRGVEHDQ
jgi:hypothetical protein